jgi:hypothetical protein
MKAGDQLQRYDEEASALVVIPAKRSAERESRGNVTALNFWMPAYAGVGDDSRSVAALLF